MTRSRRPTVALTPRQQRRQALAVVTREILKFKSRAARDLHEIGTRLIRAQDEQLYRAGGFDTFEDYLHRAVGLSRTTAYRTMRIARHFSGDLVSDYGVEKLGAVLTYMETTPADERPGDLLAARIPVANTRGGTTQITLHKASYQQIRDAIDTVAAANSRRQSIPKLLFSQSRKLSTALPPAPAGTLRGDRIRLRRGKDGQLAVSFHAIPLDNLPQFLRLVKEHLGS